MSFGLHEGSARRALQSGQPRADRSILDTCHHFGWGRFIHKPCCSRTYHRIARPQNVDADQDGYNGRARASRSLPLGWADILSAGPKQLPYCATRIGYGLPMLPATQGDGGKESSGRSSRALGDAMPYVKLSQEYWIALHWLLSRSIDCLKLETRFIISARYTSPPR